jgi:hypothetical protein
MRASGFLEGQRSTASLKNLSNSGCRCARNYMKLLVYRPDIARTYSGNESSGAHPAHPVSEPPKTATSPDS